MGTSGEDLSESTQGGGRPGAQGDGRAETTWQRFVGRLTDPGTGAAMRRTRHLRRAAGVLYTAGPAAIVVLYLMGWITDDATVVTVALAVAGFPLVVYGKGNLELLSGLMALMSTAWTIALVTSVTPESREEQLLVHDNLGEVIVVVVTAAVSLVLLAAAKRAEWPRRELVLRGDALALFRWWGRNWWRVAAVLAEGGVILFSLAADAMS